MLKFSDHTDHEKIKVENIDCNPCPPVILTVSSLVPHKYNAAMEKTVRFEEGFTGNKRRQYLAAFAANMGALAIGTMLCWTATALPDLRERESSWNLTEDQESWISSLVTLGAAAACPVTGFSLVKFGRRTTMLMLTLPFVGGWILIVLAQYVPMIYAGRFITGFCGGAFSVAAPIYIAETADVDIRGKLNAGFDLMITVGMLLMFLTGTFVSWRMQALGAGVIPIVFHILMFFVPESPRYLIANGLEPEASKALMWLRGACLPEQIHDEFVELVKSINESTEGSRGFWKDVSSPGAVHAIGIGMGLFFFQTLCGIDAVLFYTVDIFHSAGVTLDEYYSTIIVGVVQVIAAVFSALVVDRWGRRILLMSSEIFMSISLGCLGGFFYLKQKDDAYATTQFGWVPLASLLLFVVSFSIALGPIPFGIMGEILPLNIKGVGSSLLTTSKWLLSFLVTRFFNDLMESIGKDGGYWLFASICIVGVVFIFKMVPETKGRTLEEIQGSFLKEKSPTSQQTN